MEPNVTLIDETVVLTETSPYSGSFTYSAATGPNKIIIATLGAPFTTEYNWLVVGGTDGDGVGYFAEMLWEPGQSPPLDDVIELYSADFPESGSVIATLS